jgi:hypothetical protein
VSWFNQVEQIDEILERSADPQTDPELISIRLILQPVIANAMVRATVPWPVGRRDKFEKQQ